MQEAFAPSSIYGDNLTAGQDLAHRMSHMINGCGRGDSSDFIEQMATEHKTLQQKFTGDIVLAWIVKVATDKNYARFVDDRNQATLNVCRMLYKCMLENGYESGHLPLI